MDYGDCNMNSVFLRSEYCSYFFKIFSQIGNMFMFQFHISFSIFNNQLNSNFVAIFFSLAHSALMFCFLLWKLLFQYILFFYCYNLAETFLPISTIYNLYL